MAEFTFLGDSLEKKVSTLLHTLFNITVTKFSHINLVYKNWCESLNVTLMTVRVIPSGLSAWGVPQPSPWSDTTEACSECS